MSEEQKVYSLKPVKPKILGPSIGYPKIFDSFHMIRTFQAFQTMSGDPRTFDIDPRLWDFFNSLKSSHMPIIHGPYITNLVNKDHKTYQPTIEYLKKLAEFGQVGLRRVVIHAGHAFTKQTPEGDPSRNMTRANTALDHALDQVLPLLSRNGVVLCLENTVGSDSGSDPSRLGYLLGKVRQYASPFLKICYDTEHAFAAGEGSIESKSLWEQIRRSAGLVHLNAVPEGVDRGSRKDNHSSTPLSGCSVFTPSIYSEFYEFFSGVPIILERKNIELSLADQLFLKGLEE